METLRKWEVGTKKPGKRGADTMSKTPYEAGNNPNYSPYKEWGISFLLFNVRLMMLSSKKNPSICTDTHRETSLMLGRDTPKFWKIDSQLYESKLRLHNEEYWQASSS